MSERGEMVSYDYLTEPSCGKMEEIRSSPTSRDIQHSAFKGGLSGVERIGLTFPQSLFPVLAGDYFHEEEVSIYVIKYYNPITTMILFH